MSTSSFHSFADIAIKEVAPGFFSKLIHTDTNTINFIEVKAGNSVPMHQHPHQQYTFLLEGTFELTIEGETRALDPGVFALIPSGAIHGGIARTDCRLLDIFSPVREDYRAL